MGVKWESWEITDLRQSRTNIETYCETLFTCVIRQTPQIMGKELFCGERQKSHLCSSLWVGWHEVLFLLPSLCWLGIRKSWKHWLRMGKGILATQWREGCFSLWGEGGALWSTPHKLALNTLYDKLAPWPLKSTLSGTVFKFCLIRVFEECGGSISSVAHAYWYNSWDWWVDKTFKKHKIDCGRLLEPKERLYVVADSLMW